MKITKDDIVIGQEVIYICEYGQKTVGRISSYNINSNNDITTVIICSLIHPTYTFKVCTPNQIIKLIEP